MGAVAFFAAPFQQEDRVTDGALTAIGLMSGSALDGVGAAILRTDGELRVERGPAIHAPYGRAMKVFIRRAMKAALEGRDDAEDVKAASAAVTEAHALAVGQLLEKAGLAPEAIDVVGFHGHTILHRPARAPESIGRSWQIGDGAALASVVGIDVVDDFRAADIAGGGEGAPLAPVYHRALAAALGRAHPIAIVTLGDVAKLTYLPPDCAAEDILAFDCGPGTWLLDEWMGLRGAAPDGKGAEEPTGAVDETELRMMLLYPYLRRKPPKSLDRSEFKLDPATALSLEDGAATLTAFSAACLAKAHDLLPAPVGAWIMCGPGRRRPALMQALRGALGAPVLDAEDAGWRGDALEAECIAYLAARSIRRLPLTFPKTTRVRLPMPGGVLHRVT